ncbi:MAG: DUF368 domain-containing protein [Clostridia bacterium]|nr:DUF368 domain-containing protein [Clostridia bacterium]
MGKKTSNSFWLRVLQGTLIGAVCIIPGASGGVLAVALGLYEPCVNALYGFLRHFRTEGKAHFLFLLPLALGGCVGLISCSFGLEWLLQHVREPFMYALIGMVLGGLPTFFQEANQKGFRPKYLVATLIGFVVIGGAAVADRLTTGGTGLVLNSWTAMLSGAIIVAGTMMPGMSTSFFLMMLGLYEPVLNVLTHFQLDVMCFVGIGGVVGGGLMLLLIRNMLRRFHAYTYYGMLGCLLATLIMIYPGFTARLAVWDLLLLLAGFAGTWLLTKIQNKIPCAAPTATPGQHTEEEL